MYKSIFALLTIAKARNLQESSDVVRDCKEFDPNLIQLVTFDVFAALMDLESSLLRNVA